MKVPLFVSFGEDIPLMSFEDMLGYLRYFASPAVSMDFGMLRRDAQTCRQSFFVRPIGTKHPQTKTQAYFGRIQVANLEFRMDRNPG